METPGSYNLKDLSLDVRLEAIVDGTRTDFTGKKIFSIEFFRKSIGFGITDISIEVNTSLQPIITITFKDLYGNTVFGKTNSTSSDLDDANSEGVDFSVLFNWPPPKFLFTFKGYLGKSATWMLNMKKSTVSYDSSDSSYNIKCEFVPNQWGFLSDLPFLYLLAVKSLKKKSLPDEEFKKVQSVFDLIKIGKQVEVKTQETTKEFDNILQQMTLLKSQRFYDALNISKVVNYNEEISGQVGGQTISPFNSVTVNRPFGIGNSDIDSPEKVAALALSATNLRRINAFLLLTSKIGQMAPKPIAFKDVSLQNGKISIPSINNLDEEIAARTQMLSDNVQHIEDAIKKKTFDSSKDQLEKITIGEIFQQLAEDAGYIMGRILEAGHQGYKNNSASRDTLQNTLIGRNFPMILAGDNKEEKPASSTNGVNVGVENYEGQFVNDFIDAISEGIATELSDEASATSNQNTGDNLIKKRICNTEVLKQNPYKPYFQSVVENIMIRSGIVAYLVRSPDPNFPGDYDNFFGNDRATEAEDIIALADADFENISDDIISGLSDDEFKKIKNFCVFWDNFLTDDCTSLKIADNEGKLVEGDSLTFLNGYLSTPGNALSVNILDYEVVIEKPAQWNGAIESNNPLTYVKVEGLQVNTLRKVMQEIFRPKSGSGSDTTNSNFIPLDTLQAKKVINNGIAYFNPITTSTDDEYVFVMFDGPDANKTQQAMSAASDAEIKSEADEQKNETKPKGFVNIQNPLDEKGNFFEIIEEMNDNYISTSNPLLINYNRVINPDSAFFVNKTSLAGTNEYFFIRNDFGNPDSLGVNEISPKGITLAVAYHPAETELVFGPFVGGPLSGVEEEAALVQRGYIKRMCSKLKEKANGVEQKRNQVISSVLGKSGEQKDLLYKQMHVLYQQWEVLAIKDSDSAQNQNTTGDSPNAIANEMAARYTSHKEFNLAQQVADEAADNTFLYAFPLNSKPGAKQINIKNSIINIESLYKPNANTTVLNIIQQLCTKNNFIFIPMPGEPGAFSTSEIFSPHTVDTPKVKNFFYVQFAPTPESRSKLNNRDNTPISSSEFIKNNLPNGTLQVKFGSPENQIVKNISVDTDESKTTAESIVNLQRLVDNENQNKKVTTDCSMLPVMEGRSYKASIDMLGNAQVFPMQFFYLDSIPLFNGLYQIMKVKHSITPNNMTTTAEGIRMRVDYQNGDFGGVYPITLETLANIPVNLIDSAPPVLSSGDFANAVSDQGSGVLDSRTGTNSAGSTASVATVSVNKGGSDVKPNVNVSTSGIILLPNIQGVRNSIRLTQSSDANGPTQITDTDKTYTKDVIIRNLNQFITDVLEPFAAYLKSNYPHLYKNWYITSAQRSYVPSGGATISQHQKGQAVDSQIVGKSPGIETMRANLELLNAMLEWYQLNQIGYDQVLWETRASQNASWIHWSYQRNNNRKQLLRFSSDKVNQQAKVNTTGAYVLPGVTDQQILLSMT